ncbi:hypothetical protein K445DRAFT_320727 [Daldinia sp. EC12]|nr:hypothetical protein F4774DRAFT_29606 [Daldinia eschscholtzii]OTB12894.1 hypothetical protein K445DRAFT_320727 [Daldinia sp. EC12]
MASRIPPLLDAYLHLPPETSLVLLSGVLGSSTNWLVLRYLYSLLSTPSNSLVTREDGKEDIDSSSTEDVSVVFISFLRDYTFWKDGAGKLGLDLDVLARKGNFIFIDGLSRLFFASPNPILEHSPDKVRKKALSVASLQHLRKELEDAVAQSQRSASKQRTVLIADQLDLILAASGNDISSQALRDTLLGIREVSYQRMKVLHILRSKYRRLMIGLQ